MLQNINAKFNVNSERERDGKAGREGERDR